MAAASVRPATDGTASCADVPTGPEARTRGAGRLCAGAAAAGAAPLPTPAAVAGTPEGVARTPAADGQQQERAAATSAVPGGVGAATLSLPSTDLMKRLVQSLQKFKSSGGSGKGSPPTLGSPAASGAEEGRHEPSLSPLQPRKLSLAGPATAGPGPAGTLSPTPDAGGSPRQLGSRGERQRPRPGQGEASDAELLARSQELSRAAASTVQRAAQAAPVLAAAAARPSILAGVGDSGGAPTAAAAHTPGKAGPQRPAGPPAGGAPDAASPARQLPEVLRSKTGARRAAAGQLPAQEATTGSPSFGAMVNAGASPELTPAWRQGGSRIPNLSPRPSAAPSASRGVAGAAAAAIQRVACSPRTAAAAAGSAQAQAARARSTMRGAQQQPRSARDAAAAARAASAPRAARPSTAGDGGAGGGLKARAGAAVAGARAAAAGARAAGLAAAGSRAARRSDSEAPPPAQALPLAAAAASQPDAGVLSAGSPGMHDAPAVAAPLGQQQPQQPQQAAAEKEELAGLVSVLISQRCVPAPLPCCGRAKGLPLGRLCDGQTPMGSPVSRPAAGAGSSWCRC